MFMLDTDGTIEYKNKISPEKGKHVIYIILHVYIKYKRT